MKLQYALPEQDLRTMLRSRVERQMFIKWPLFIGLSLTIWLSAYRLFQRENAFLGDDVFFTFTVSLSFFLSLVSVLLFYDKYFNYLSKKGVFASIRTIKQATKFRKRNVYVILLDILSTQLMWISCPKVIGDSDVSAVILRIALGLTVFRTTYLLYLSRKVLNCFIEDLRAATQITRKLQDDAHFSIKAGGNKSEEQDRHHRTLKHVIRLRRIIIFLCVLTYFTCVLAALWEYWLLQFGYIMPALLSVWALCTLISLPQMPVKRRKRVKSAGPVESKPWAEEEYEVEGSVKHVTARSRTNTHRLTQLSIGSDTARTKEQELLTNILKKARTKERKHNSNIKSVSSNVDG